MARPSTEAEYLARLVPPSVAGTSRRLGPRGALVAAPLRGMLCWPPVAAAAAAAPEQRRASWRPER